MAKVTAKENFMKILHGETPYYVPFFSLMGASYRGECPMAGAFVPFFEDHKMEDGGLDMWGVPHVMASEGVRNTMPDTRINILKDIEDWSKVIKFPKALDVDLDKAYRDNCARIDRENTALGCNPGFSPFQQLVAMMGFEGGLMALYEDPEEVKAMLNAMVDHIEPYYRALFDKFQPDVWSMADDTCSKLSPFFSPEVYEDVFLPIYKRLADPAIQNGVPVVFHNCGYCTPFLDFMTRFGVKFTEPYQDANKVETMKTEFKGRLAFGGHFGWGQHIPKGWPDFDEEYLRNDIRQTIDECCVDGGYAFGAFPLTEPGDPAGERALEVMRDEVYYYGKKVYGYTGE